MPTDQQRARRRTSRAPSRSAWRATPTQPTCTGSPCSTAPRFHPVRCCWPRSTACCGRRCDRRRHGDRRSVRSDRRRGRAAARAGEGRSRAAARARAVRDCAGASRRASREPTRRTPLGSAPPNPVPARPPSVGDTGDRVPTNVLPRAFDRQPVPRPRSHSWLPAFVALSAIWGSSFLFIKVADRAVPPVAVGARSRRRRRSHAAVPARRRPPVPLPRGRSTWGHLAVVALIGNALPFTLIAYGETRISSVLAGIWNATTPLLTLLVAIVVLSERRRARAPSASPSASSASCACSDRGRASAAARCRATSRASPPRPCTRSPSRTRAATSPRSGCPRASLAAGQLLCATGRARAARARCSAACRSGRPRRWSARCSRLGALGTGLRLRAQLRAHRARRRDDASTVTYVIPLFATALGVIVLGEGLTWNEPLGAAIVLLGVASHAGPAHRARAPPRRRRPGAGRDGDLGRDDAGGRPRARSRSSACSRSRRSGA